MKIYDFRYKKKLVFKGDVHGEFSSLFFYIKTKPLNNSLIIVLGDCGIGFNKPKYYEYIFEKENEYLAQNNIHILMIRGNHDDPSYFNEEKIDYSNIKTIQDYSVILTQQGNILCVGGAISSDRTWRKREEERINKYRKNSSFIKKLYWENEAPYLNNEIVNFLQSNNLKVTILATHSSPSFNLSSLSTNHINNWALVDENLVDDIEAERQVLDSLFTLLKDNNHNIEFWYHGHYHQLYEWYFDNGDVVFRGLGDRNELSYHTQEEDENVNIEEFELLF